MGQINSTDFLPSEGIRYARHFSLSEVGILGQKKLKAARVLCVGAGGLGSPILMYLAAAGVGTIGILDNDHVELSNLQRQLLYTTDDIGKAKVQTAKNKLLQLNPELNIIAHEFFLDKTNALSLVQNYDIVVDGADNFVTRYLINDVCFHLKKPNVYGSIFQFEGQCSVFNVMGGPCYRCLYPAPPPPGLLQNCAEGGVLGVVAGLIGTIQATEVIKLILNTGDSLHGRLLTVDVLSMRFKEYAVQKNADCCLCIQKQSFESLAYHDLLVCPYLASSADDEITVQTLQDMQRKAMDFILLDIREPHEYAICNLGGQLIPFAQLEKKLSVLDKNKNYVVHCKIGERSRHTVNLMREKGFVSVRHLTGGIKAWAKEIDPTLPAY